MTKVAGAVKSGLFKREYRDHRLEWMIRSGGLDVVLEGMQNRQHPLFERAALMSTRSSSTTIPTSPFSEKVRVAFGIKKLAWRSVEHPVMHAEARSAFR